MRTRRFANSERIRAKERRLAEVNRRQEAARTLSMLPRGVIGALAHSTPIGSSTSTISAPLLALVVTAAETWNVDQAAVPDPTGGFADVVIAPGKQIGELAANQTVSFAGLSGGTYLVFASHQAVDEHPETREPPGKYAGGTGVFEEHRDFFGHAEVDGAPIPREGYDATLAPVVVSELVDRLAIGVALEASAPASATPLLRVTWNGAAITSVTVIARGLDLTSLFEHVGAGGTAHAVATSASAGFLSANDKAKLDNASSAPLGGTLAQRSGSGTLKAATPQVADDLATKAYVDSGASQVASHDHDTRYVRFDASQTLSADQRTTARANIGAANAVHNHDTVYYTQSQVTALLNTKLGTGATAHDSDRLGGQLASNYMRTSGNVTAIGAYTYSGTLAVTGTLRIPVR